jgi:hypothetical protein
MVVLILPLQSKYRTDIFNAIAESLLQSETDLTYSALYQKVLDILDYILSHRDFVACLQVMVNENTVNKIDKSGKRGSKIYYSLSENARTQHQLRILKVDKDYETKRSIYQILLYFHSFKRGELLTQRQLNKKLFELGLRFEDLQQVNYGEDRVTAALTGNIKYTEVNAFTDPIGNIAVVEYKDNENNRFAKNNVVYYLYIPGFTVTEFIIYIKKLRKMKEPRPFSDYPPLVPYIFYRNFTDIEIKEAIELFNKAGLIKIIPPIIAGETRYYLSDDSLIGLITIIRQIQEIMVHKVITKLTYIESPDDNDRQILGYYFGKKAADITIAKAHEVRKDLRKKPDTNIESKKIIEEYDNNINSLISSLDEIYGSKFKSSDLLINLIVDFPKTDRN